MDPAWLDVTYPTEADAVDAIRRSADAYGAEFRVLGDGDRRYYMTSADPDEAMRGIPYTVREADGGWRVRVGYPWAPPRS